jgi:hypothetical protein
LRPELDDIKKLTNFRNTRIAYFGVEYDRSFYKFANLENNKLEINWQLDFEEYYDDRSRVGMMLSIIKIKLNLDHSNLLRDETANQDKISLFAEPAFAESLLDFFTIFDEHTYRFQRFANRRRLSSSMAYMRLLRYYLMVNPPAEVFDSLDKYRASQSLPYAEERSSINKAVYKNEPNETINARVMRDARRLYEDLRQRIGSTLHSVTLVGQFKMRAMLYDKKRLRDIADNKVGKIYNREDSLALELATWLFDRGLPVYLKVNLQNLQPDLLGIDLGFLIETKVYEKPSKKELCQGIAQLHAYMNTLEGSSRYVREAFYVVFRLAGNLVDLPVVIDTNHFRIHTVVIDLGDASNSGRRQPKPMVIQLNEILDAISTKK